MIIICHDNLNDKQNTDNIQSEILVPNKEIFNTSISQNSKNSIVDSKNIDSQWKIDLDSKIKWEKTENDRQLGSTISASAQFDDFKMSASIDPQNLSNNYIKVQLPKMKICQIKISVKEMQKYGADFKFLNGFTLGAKSNHSTDDHVLTRKAKIEILKLLSITNDIVEDLVFTFKHDESQKNCFLHKIKADLHLNISSFEVIISCEITFNDYKDTSWAYTITISNSVSITINMQKLWEWLQGFFSAKYTDNALAMIEQMSMNISLIKHLEKVTSSKAVCGKVKNGNRLSVYQEKTCHNQMGGC